MLIHRKIATFHGIACKTAGLITSVYFAVRKIAKKLGLVSSDRLSAGRRAFLISVEINTTDWLVTASSKNPASCFSEEVLHFLWKMNKLQESKFYCKKIHRNLLLLTSLVRLLIYCWCARSHVTLHFYAVTSE